MALMRREPSGEMESMRRGMDRLFDQMFSGLTRGLPGMESWKGLSPSVELYTTDNEVVLKAELPGMNPEDVEVEITEDAVHLSGELHKEQEIQEDNYFHSERQYGRFDRMVPLPNRVKDGEAKAHFKNGVLTIRAPLAEEIKKPQSRKLNIEAE